MESLDAIVSLGKYGVVGVMIALILLCGITIYLLWKLATNHINHSNAVFRENTEALVELKQFLKDKLK